MAESLVADALKNVFINQDKKNAEYLEEAMGIHPPHPTKRFEFCSDETLTVFMENIKVAQPQYFELEAMCAEPLGFYLFRKYCKSNDSGAYSDLLNDLAIFRVSPYNARKSLAARIIYYYLLDNSTGTAGRRSSVLLEQFTDRNVPSDTLPNNDIVEDPLSLNWLRVSGDSVENIFNITQVPRTIQEWTSNYLDETTVLSSIDVTQTLFDTLDVAIFEHLKDTYFNGYRNSDYFLTFFRLMERASRSFKADDFVYLRMIGRGGFGMVKACKSKETGKMFASKIMNKKRIKYLDSPDLILEERKVMTMVSSPYTVCLKYAFQTATDLYLLLDLMTGGDLGFHLGKRGSFPIEECIYYSARLVMGIKALHDLEIVYRDLKPENILLDEFGYSRISDFGLACRMRKNGLSEACGTRGYWAPEMLRRDEHGNKERYYLPVDWFSLGCVIYEFHNGIGPYRTDRARKWRNTDGKLSKEDVMDNATREMDVEYDEEVFPPEAIDLISKLLNRNPHHRLGANGADEILAHPYFSSIDFPHLELMKPPYKPPKNINTANQKDIGDFTTKETKGITWGAEDEELYAEWDFTNMLHFQQEVVGFMRFEDVLGRTIEPVNQTPRNTCRQS